MNNLQIKNSLNQSDDYTVPSVDELVDSLILTGKVTFSTWSLRHNLMINLCLRILISDIRNNTVASNAPRILIEIKPNRLIKPFCLVIPGYHSNGLNESDNILIGKILTNYLLDKDLRITPFTIDQELLNGMVFDYRLFGLQALNKNKEFLYKLYCYLIDNGFLSIGSYNQYTNPTKLSRIEILNKITVRGHYVSKTNLSPLKVYGNSSKVQYLSFEIVSGEKKPYLKISVIEKSEPKDNNLPVGKVFHLPLDYNDSCEINESIFKQINKLLTKVYIHNNIRGCFTFLVMNELLICPKFRCTSIFRPFN